MLCLLTLLLMALPLLATACNSDDREDTPADEKEITIGGTYHLSGPPAASTGPAFRRFRNMIRYVNEVEGGIDGIEINLVWADDKYDPATAAIAYKRLRDRHHPLLWVPTGADYMLTPVKDMFERDKTPVLIASAFTRELFDPPGMIFAFRNNDANIFTGLARWVLEDWEGPGRPKLAHLHWDDKYGNAAREGGGYRWAEEHGVDIIDRTYMPMPLDLRPQLLDLRDKGADYIYLSGIVTNATVLVRDARATGLWDEMTFIIDHATAPYMYLLPVIGEDAEGLYQVTMEEPWTAGPEVAKAHRIEQESRQWAGESPTPQDFAYSGAVKQILTALIRQAVADVGYENLSGQAMYNALLKLKRVDTLGSYHSVGWGPDKRIGQSGIKLLRYTKTEASMQTFAISDWIETTNIFEGE
jgi:ABC-type branched-subunit amino acid transport system substrate-binding protein